jgi:hypothetical protein
MDPLDGGAMIERYLAALDSGEAIDAADWCGSEFRFSILWGTEDGGAQIAGDRAAYEQMLAARIPPPDHRHHILYRTGDGHREVCFGRTTQQGEPLATFVFAVDLDERGLMRQLFAARATNVAIGDLPEVA